MLLPGAPPNSFTSSGSVFECPTTTTAPLRARTFSTSALGAAAMGAHSATSKMLLNHLAPTSMMTGNVTQLVIDTVDRLRGAADAATRARCAKFFWPVLAFALGCAAAAFAFRAFGFVALAVPVAILCWHLSLSQPEQ